jgi:hypothetical protein
MLSEEEKNELRQMGKSVRLREEFQMLRQNSQALERGVSIDELMRWLTAMTQILPSIPPRPFLEYRNARI